MLDWILRRFDDLLDLDVGVKFLLARAEGHLRDGDFAASREDCLGALRELERREHPNEPRAPRAAVLRLAGLASYLAGRLEEAADHLGEALRAAPADPEVCHALALVYLRLGEHADALNYARQALQLSPRFAPAALLQGETLVALGRYDEARAALEPYISKNEKYPSPPRAAARDEEPDPFERLLPAAPARAARARRALARAHLGLGDLSAAGEVLEEAGAKDPPDAEVAWMLGSVRLQEGRVAEAAEAFGAAVRIDPRHAESHLELARILQFTEGDPAEAAAHFDRAVALRGEDAGTLAAAAAFHAERGDALRALELTERAWNAAPEDLALLVDLCERRLRMRLYRTARAAVEEYFRRIDWALLETDPARAVAVGLVRALVVRAELLAAEGRLDEARRTLDPLLPDPDLPEHPRRLSERYARHAARLSYLLAVPAFEDGALARLALARCRGAEIELRVVLGRDDIADPTGARERIPGLEELLASALPVALLAVHPHEEAVRDRLNAFRPIETFWNLVELELFLHPRAGLSDAESLVERAASTDLNDEARLDALLDEVNGRFLGLLAEVAGDADLPRRLGKLGVKEWPLARLFQEVCGPRGASPEALLGVPAGRAARDAKKKRPSLTPRDEGLFDDPVECAAALAGVPGERALLLSPDPRRALVLALRHLDAGMPEGARLVVALPPETDAAALLDLLAVAAPSLAARSADLTGGRRAACRMRLDALGASPLDARDRLLFTQYERASRATSPGRAAEGLFEFERTLFGTRDGAERILRATSAGCVPCASGCPAGAEDCPARAQRDGGAGKRLIFCDAATARTLPAHPETRTLLLSLDVFARFLEPVEERVADDLLFADLARALSATADAGMQADARRMEAESAALGRDLAPLLPEGFSRAGRGGALSLLARGDALLLPFDLLARRFERLRDRTLARAGALRDLVRRAAERLPEPWGGIARAVAAPLSELIEGAADPATCARFAFEVTHGGFSLLRLRPAAETLPARLLVLAGPAEARALELAEDRLPDAIRRLPRATLGDLPAGPAFDLAPAVPSARAIDLAAIADRLGDALGVRARGTARERNVALLLSFVSLIEALRFAGQTSASLSPEAERIEPGLFAEYGRRAAPLAVAPFRVRPRLAECHPLVLSLLGTAEGARAFFAEAHGALEGGSPLRLHLQAASGSAADTLGALFALTLARASGRGPGAVFAPARPALEEILERFAEFALILPERFLRFVPDAAAGETSGPVAHFASAHRALPEADGYRAVYERTLAQAVERPDAARIYSSPWLCAEEGSRLPLANRPRVLRLPPGFDLRLERAECSGAAERATLLARLAARDASRTVVHVDARDHASTLAALRARNVAGLPSDADGPLDVPRVVVRDAPDVDRPLSGAGRAVFAGMPLDPLRLLACLDAARLRAGGTVTFLDQKGVPVPPPQFAFGRADFQVAMAYLRAYGGEVRHLGAADLATEPFLPPGRDPERALAALARGRFLEVRGALHTRLPLRLKREEVDLPSLPDDEQALFLAIRDLADGAGVPAGVVAERRDMLPDDAVRALFRLERRGLLSFDDRIELEMLDDPAKLSASAERETETAQKVLDALLSTEGFADGSGHAFSAGEWEERELPWFQALLSLACRGHVEIARDGADCRVRSRKAVREVKADLSRDAAMRRRLAEILRTKALGGAPFSCTFRDIAERFAHSTGVAPDPLEVKRALCRFMRERLLRAVFPPALSLLSYDLKVDAFSGAWRDVSFGPRQEAADPLAALPEGDLSAALRALDPSDA